ncbi:hypothetical protein, partial [Caballeronia novacaledonica]|uniref:hypothetical protein n=1 Tax=Caballeronia novacaledonica TaxID=1544861 RepID=UPI001EE235F4
ANMLTVITPFSCLASKQEVEHVGQFSMQISSGSGSVLRAHQQGVASMADRAKKMRDFSACLGSIFLKPRICRISGDGRGARLSDERN